jgi:hypothetical protein
MNGSTSPGPHTAPVEPAVTENHDAPATINGHEGAEGTTLPTATPAEGATVAPAADEDTQMVDRPELEKPEAPHGGDDAESEAETLISTPVKKREAEKQKQNVQVKAEKPARSRIGGLPVPGEDDEESESIATPVQSTEMNDVKRASSKEATEMDLGNNKEDSSDSLSSPRSPPSIAGSRSSSRTRALSERPDYTREDADSRNPRKRKHRASSVSLPNKRRSMDPPKRKLRGMQSEDNALQAERSPSPRLRNHRRAVSTQSVLGESAGAEGSGRKRRTAPQFPVRDSRPARPWEESDASSETTSHGHIEARRPQRGVGRSTSTPGRHGGREHKRHVNKYGFTKLAEACDTNDLDAVKEWREKDPDQLEIAEYAGNKPLQIAALRGNEEIVAYLIDQGCQIDCANADKDTPLIDAAENGHLDVVQILLKAGVDPLRQNLKGQQALDVVTDETDEADGIRAALREAIEHWNSDDAKLKRENEEEQRHRAGPSKEVFLMARTYENLQRLVQINDRNGVREFLDARVPVDNALVALAAKTGDQYLVNMLLAEMPEKKAYQKPEKPMQAVLGTSHFEMVQMLTTLDQFNPLYRDRNGKTWPEIAEDRKGPNMRQERELLQRLYDERSRTLGRRSSSPVAKRENGKRRLVHEPTDDDSSEEHAPKRKNGRRLMSRRDMRAASGKVHSDSDSEGVNSTSDDAPGEPEPIETSAVMKPPASPRQRRTSDRQRTKSLSTQPADISPRTRRRSSSLRGSQDQILPTLVEKKDVEEQDALAKQREIAARLEAQRLETQRKEAEEAEEQARRVEEAKKAEEARQREEEERGRRAEEEAKRAEAIRQAEEDRKRKEVEMENARSSARSEILASLPDSVRQAMESEIEADRSFLLSRFTPLLVIREDYEGPWVSNVQAAPLLGKRGLELLLPRNNHLEFQTTFSRYWPITSNLSEREMTRRQKALAALCASEGEDEALVSSDDFQAELAYKVQRLKAINRAKQRLSSGTVPLFCVRLRDVLAHLHPVLGGVNIEVQFYPQPPKSPLTPSNDGVSRKNGTYALPSRGLRLIRFYKALCGDDLQEAEQEYPTKANFGRTKVTIVHEK